MIVPMMVPMATFLFRALTAIPYNWGRQSAQQAKICPPSITFMCLLLQVDFFSQACCPTKTPTLPEKFPTYILKSLTVGSC